MSRHYKQITLAGAVLSAFALAVIAGPEWVVDNTSDAGSLPGDSQVVTGTGTPGSPVTKISGRLGDSTIPPTLVGGAEIDLEDMYVIDIDDPDTFFASTVISFGGDAEFDTRLWLFNLDGTGLLANDDSFEIIIGFGGTLVTGSTLFNTATDEGESTIPGPGQYLLAISTAYGDPLSQNGPIFEFDVEFPGEISSPDGPGGEDPIIDWAFVPPIFDFGAPSGFGGQYTISLQGVVALSGVTTAYMDIKPGGCPNPFNRVSNGVLPVSLCGTADFDVNDVVLSSVVISRADGIGGSIGPIEGPPGPHSTYVDNATPFTGDECDCHDLDGDGFIDLSMKFKSQDMVAACELNDLPAGALVRMKISGELEDGSTFEAYDCLRLVPPGSPPGLAQVTATASAAWIDASPLDLQLDGGGFGNFQRTYPQPTVMTLTATPLSGYTFKGWRVNGSSSLVKGWTLTYTVNSETQSMEAVYERSAPATISSISPGVR